MSNLLMLLLVAVATALIVGLVVVLSRGRGTPYLKMDLKTLPPIDEALPLLAGLTESAVYEGNKATLFQNGSAFPAMLADIAAAKCSVHLETFVWCEGKLEDQFVQALSEKARAGVPVRVLRDAVGGSRGSQKGTCELQNHGVTVAEYCSPSWWNIGRFNS